MPGVTSPIVLPRLPALMCSSTWCESWLRALRAVYLQFFFFFFFLHQGYPCLVADGSLKIQFSCTGVCWPRSLSKIFQLPECSCWSRPRVPWIFSSRDMSSICLLPPNVGISPTKSLMFLSRPIILMLLYWGRVRG